MIELKRVISSGAICYIPGLGFPGWTQGRVSCQPVCPEGSGDRKVGIIKFLPDILDASLKNYNFLLNIFLLKSYCPSFSLSWLVWMWHHLLSVCLIFFVLSSSIRSFVHLFMIFGAWRLLLWWRSTTLNNRFFDIFQSRCLHSSTAFSSARKFFGDCSFNHCIFWQLSPSERLAYTIHCFRVRGCLVDASVVVRNGDSNSSCSRSATAGEHFIHSLGVSFFCWRQLGVGLKALIAYPTNERKARGSAFV